MFKLNGGIVHAQPCVRLGILLGMYAQPAPSILSSCICFWHFFAQVHVAYLACLCNGLEQMHINLLSKTALVQILTNCKCTYDSDIGRSVGVCCELV